jgi:hypothetical protein
MRLVDRSFGFVSLRFSRAHNDPRVRAAEEMPAITFQQRGFHVAHHTAYNRTGAISTHVG